MFTLACVIAPARVWQRFAEAWDKAMQRGGADGGSMHMREFVTGRGQFDAWGNDEKVHLLKKLVPVVVSYISLGLVGSIPLRDFNEIVGGLERRASDNVTPYLLLLQAAIEQVIERLNPSKDNPVTCIFESNGQNEGDVIRQVYHIALSRGWEGRIAEAEFRSKAAAVPLSQLTWLHTKRVGTCQSRSLLSPSVHRESCSANSLGAVDSYLRAQIEA